MVVDWTDAFSNNQNIETMLVSSARLAGVSESAQKGRFGAATLMKGKSTLNVETMALTYVSLPINGEGEVPSSKKRITQVTFEIANQKGTMTVRNLAINNEILETRTYDCGSIGHLSGH